MDSKSTDINCSTLFCSNKPRLIVRKDLPSERVVIAKEQSDPKDYERFIYTYPIDLGQRCTACYDKERGKEVGYQSREWGKAGCPVIKADKPVNQ